MSTFDFLQQKSRYQPINKVNTTSKYIILLLLYKIAIIKRVLPCPGKAVLSFFSRVKRIRGPTDYRVYVFVLQDPNTISDSLITANTLVLW